MPCDPERTSFDRLVLESLPAAMKFAIRLTGGVDAAEDVVQEALMRASRGWKTFRGGSQFRTWLFQIVVHSFRDRGRRRGGTDSLPADWDVEDPRAPDPAESASTAERGRIVAQTVSRLPPRQREVLVLHVYEQLSITEVAAVLGISETNVRAHLSYARTRLKEWLASYREQESRER